MKKFGISCNNILLEALTLAAMGAYIAMSFTSCGQSGNSRVLVRDSNIETEAEQGTDTVKKCIKGCFGVPQSWFDAGIVTDSNKKPITFDPGVNAYGSCHFIVCPDANDPFRKGAKEYVEAFTGGLFDDPSKCAATTSLVIASASAQEELQQSRKIEIMSVAQDQEIQLVPPSCE